MSDSLEGLIASAQAAFERAYAPYSGFRVGAALESTDGRVFSGCNVENLSYGLTMCAERVAIGNAVAAGAQKFRRLVVFTESNEPCAVCGACRQVLAEFCDDLQILSVTLAGARREDQLADLLPLARTGILDVPRRT